MVSTTLLTLLISISNQLTHFQKIEQQEVKSLCSFWKQENKILIDQNKEPFFEYTLSWHTLYFDYLCNKRPFNVEASHQFDFINEKLKSKEYYVPILMFHYIQDIPSNTKDQLWYRLSYSPNKLKDLLEKLEENNITPITFYQLKLIMEWKKEKPEKMIILSFDDWHKDHYTNAFPILKEKWVKGVFFVISWKPDNDYKFANWKELEEMVADGQEIGSHSMTHSNLALSNQEKIYNEVVNSKKILEEKLDIKVISFCYPSWRFQNNYLQKLVWENYAFGRTTQHWLKASFNKRTHFPTYRIHPTTKIDDILKLYK